MEQLFLFNGTPRDFGLLAHELSRRSKKKTEPILSVFGAFHVEHWNEVNINPDVNPVIVRIFSTVTVSVQSDVDTSPQTMSGYPARIEAYRIPAGKSRLILICPDEDWPMVEPRWSQLHEAMQRDGWLDTIQHAQQETLLRDDAKDGQIPVEEPERVAPLDDWIMWWYEANIRYYEHCRTGYRPTIKEVAEKAGRSCNAVNVHKTRDPHHRFGAHKKRLSACKAALKHRSPEDGDEES